MEYAQSIFFVCMIKTGVILTGGIIIGLLIARLVLYVMQRRARNIFRRIALKQAREVKY